MQAVSLNWCRGIKNFGDELSPYVVSKITGRKVKYATQEETSLYAVGSILNYDVLRGNNIIWGAGTLTANALKLLPKIFPVNRNIPKAIRRIFCRKSLKADVRAVRGRLTRKYLIESGVECPEVYGDPAIVLGRYFQPDVYPIYDVGIILHHSQEKAFGQLDFNKFSMRRISVKCPSVESVETTISEICHCKKIFTSSLHGLIVAQVYGVPAQWIQIKGARIHNDPFHKFYDYFSGVGLPLERPSLLSVERIGELKDYMPKKVIINDKCIDSILSAFPYDSV